MRPLFGAAIIAVVLVAKSTSAVMGLCWTCETVWYDGDECWFSSCVGSWYDGAGSCAQTGNCDSGSICVPYGECDIQITSNGLFAAGIAGDQESVDILSAAEETRRGCNGVLLAEVYTDAEAARLKEALAVIKV